MIPGMTAVRWLAAVGLVVVALVLQVSFFPHLSFHGVVPNVCLLVVVAAALVRGPEQAALLGFVAGVLLDLAPPADHVAGRWALALVLVGYVAGWMRPEPGAGEGSASGSISGVRPTATAVIATVAASSFVGTSVYAISGLLLQDPVVSVVDLLPVILAGVVWDVLLTPFVVPPVMRLFTALEPARAHV